MRAPGPFCFWGGEVLWRWDVIMARSLLLVWDITNSWPKKFLGACF